jgi:hypothetical protein
MRFQIRVLSDQAGRRGRGRAAGLAAGLGLCGVGIALAVACSGDVTGTVAPTTEFGATIVLGNGTARSYLISQGSTPTELGIALSATALDGLQTVPQMGGYESLLPLPAHNPTQFQVIGLNWNPGGHPPPLVYTVPHFDFHFYMTSLADRNTIDPTDPAFGTRAANLPSSGLRPAGYAADPPTNAIPHMGLHWTDTTSAEFHGQPFTRTFIAGSWDGQFTFLEPMVTRAYLLTHPKDLITVQRAAQSVAGGYYPTAYRVAWDSASAEWHIALANLGH